MKPSISALVVALKTRARSVACEARRRILGQGGRETAPLGRAFPRAPAVLRTARCGFSRRLDFGQPRRRVLTWNAVSYSISCGGLLEPRLEKSPSAPRLLAKFLRLGKCALRAREHSDGGGANREEFFARVDAAKYP